MTNEEILQLADKALKNQEMGCFKLRLFYSSIIFFSVVGFGIFTYVDAGLDNILLGVGMLIVLTSVYALMPLIAYRNIKRGKK